MQYDAMKAMQDMKQAENTAVQNPLPDQGLPTEAPEEATEQFQPDIEPAAEKQTPAPQAEAMPADPMPVPDPVLFDLFQEQANKVDRMNELLLSCKQSLDVLTNKANAPLNPAAQPANAAVESKQILAEIEALKAAAARQEKANTDILRDSKNFQAGVRANMQDELDQYHKLHSQNVFAPLLAEIAGLYISTDRYISTLSDQNIRTQLETILLESIEELLEDQGVTLSRSAMGQNRSLKTCKTRKTVPTADESLNGLVAHSYNPSFSLGNLVLQKEVIDTYVFDPNLKEAQMEPTKEAVPCDAQENMDLPPAETLGTKEEGTDQQE